MLKLIGQISGNKDSTEGTNNTPPPIPLLLKASLRNEWETTLLIGLLMKGILILEFLWPALGDEAKHFELIKTRINFFNETISLEELNIRSPMYNVLIEQKITFDRAVTGPFAREALDLAKNKLFLDYCQKIEDTETITIYKIIHDETLERTTNGQGEV